MKNNSSINISQYFNKGIESIFSFNESGLPLVDLVKEIGMPLESLAVPEQVHSNHVKRIESPGQYLSTDGLVTSKTGIVLSVKVADCVPVFFYDSTNGIIGLVHSGWRGTINKIIPNTINIMYKMGLDINSLEVYMGPAIKACCYEVNGKVAKLFSEDAKQKLDFKKWKIDLHKEIQLQLLKLGVQSKSIYSSKICTYESERCHSYRRDNSEKNRMYGFMVLD